MSINNFSAIVSNYSSNVSKISHYDPMRLKSFVTFNLYVGALAVFVSIICNVYLILTFSKRRRLITPFTIQILIFVIINLTTLLIEGPLNIATFLNPRLFTIKYFCSIYKFGAWTFQSIMLLQQTAIGVDRWLALLQPVWYRRKTVKYSIKVTGCLIVYYFTLYLPLFIADTLHNVPPGERCDIHNVYPDYQLFVRVATYYVPQGFTYISYPILLLMIRQHHRRVLAVNERTARISMFMSDKRTEVDTSLDVPVNVTPFSKKAMEKVTSKRAASLQEWMMLVQIICSFPFTVTYTLIQFTKLDLLYLHDMNSFCIMLTSLNMVLDPLIYWTFFRDLREETMRLVRCHCSDGLRR